ncbi:MAG: glycosyltransferase [Pseudomonadota bacterium]
MSSDHVQMNATGVENIADWDGPLLMSGSYNANSLIHMYGEHFEAFGHKVFRHYGAFEAGVTGVKLLDRVLLRASPGIVFSHASSQLEHLASTQKPAVILIFKGMDIKPDALRRLKDRGFKLVCYNADHPYDFALRGTGNQNVSASVSIYDLYVTYSRKIQEEILERDPDTRTAIVPFGHSVSDDDVREIEDVIEIERICFAGTADAMRAKSIQCLAEAGLPVDVYGPGWKNFCGRTKNVRVMGAVYGKELYRVLRAYKVQLNLFRPHNEGAHNMRSFEIPACGGVMLAPYSTDHASQFVRDEEAFYYSDRRSMIDMAHHVLNLDPQKISKVRIRARTRCVESGYSYAARSRSLAMLIADVAAS